MAFSEVGGRRSEFSPAAGLKSGRIEKETDEHQNANRTSEECILSSVFCPSSSSSVIPYSAVRCLIRVIQATRPSIPCHSISSRRQSRICHPSLSSVFCLCLPVLCPLFSVPINLVQYFGGHIISQLHRFIGMFGQPDHTPLFPGRRWPGYCGPAQSLH